MKLTSGLGWTALISAGILLAVTVYLFLVPPLNEVSTKDYGCGVEPMICDVASYRTVKTQEENYTPAHTGLVVTVVLYLTSGVLLLAGRNRKKKF